MKKTVLKHDVFKTIKQHFSGTIDNGVINYAHLIILLTPWDSGPFENK